MISIFILDNHLMSNEFKPVSKLTDFRPNIIQELVRSRGDEK